MFKNFTPRATHCEWPISENNGRLQYCGEHIEGKSSYCNKHHAVAYYTPNSSEGLDDKALFSVPEYCLEDDET
jgi:hypothetical protein